MSDATLASIYVNVSAGERADMEAALNSTFALASVGIAAVHTMQAVLPSAAGDVERASRDLAERFMMLADGMSKQNTLIKTLFAMLATSKTKNADVKGLEKQASSTSNMLDEVVSAMIVDMQFQDRNTQMMENAARILERYGNMLEDVRNNIEVARENNAEVGSHITRAIENILSGIRIGEMRAQFMESLGKAKVLYRSGEDTTNHTSSNEESIELF